MYAIHSLEFLPPLLAIISAHGPSEYVSHEYEPSDFFIAKLLIFIFACFVLRGCNDSYNKKRLDVSYYKENVRISIFGTIIYFIIHILFIYSLDLNKWFDYLIFCLVNLCYGRFYFYYTWDVIHFSRIDISIIYCFVPPTCALMTYLLTYNLESEKRRDGLLCFAIFCLSDLFFIRNRFCIHLPHVKSKNVSQMQLQHKKDITSLHKTLLLSRLRSMEIKQSSSQFVMNQSVPLGDIRTIPAFKLFFNSPFDWNNTGHIKMSNCSPHLIGYIINVSNMKKLRVEPSHGVLDPNEIVLLVVTYIGDDDGQNNPYNDRITIEWTNVPDSTLKQFQHEWFESDGLFCRKNIQIEYNM